MTDETFGLMLRRPGPAVEDEHGFPATPVYIAPDFATPAHPDVARAGSDPRYEPETEWSLSLPHHCGDWEFWDGPREDVLAAAHRLRAELDGAIAAMEAADD